MVPNLTAKQMNIAPRNKASAAEPLGGVLI